MNIMRNLVSAGYSDGFPYVPMLIITTENIGSRIIIPKNQKSWNRLKQSIIAIMELMVTGA